MEGVFTVAGFLIFLAIVLWFVRTIDRFVSTVETIAENSSNWVVPIAARKELTADEVIRGRPL